MRSGRAKDRTPVVRCAIYTRKSTEEGLDQEFNSLDAQRESGEAYIASMKHEGWDLVPERYDDGGFTGGNVERPSLQRLLDDIEARRIDCVVVYKVDRLSRSLLDFARLMQLFEKHNVAFVSVTQRFDTSNSMGRLTLNMLMSFAQFEREMISERTRDKIAATRRKGKWSGGMPLLGYDVVDGKLVVLPAEAEQVRQIFELYLSLQSLLATAAEVSRRGWTTKQWTTKKGVRRGGLPFGKTKLHQLLTNVTYLGKIRYKDEVHEGEHEAIVDGDTFRRVKELLASKSAASAAARNKHGGLLRGILRCAACDCGMVHTYTSNGNRRYRYYVCAKAQQHGWKTCPAPSLAAAEIERFVVDQIRCVGRDPTLVAATVAETRRQRDEAIQGLKRERAALQRQRRDDAAELGRLGAAEGKGGACQAQVEERLGAATQRLVGIRDEVDRLTKSGPSDDAVAEALAEFDGMWAALSPHEQSAAFEYLIERVEFDGATGLTAITFHATGIKALDDKQTQIEETAA